MQTPCCRERKQITLPRVKEAYRQTDFLVTAWCVYIALVAGNVMDATYLDIRVWLVERKQETDMAASSIFDDGRSRISER